jgi:hypothetical protein
MVHAALSMNIEGVSSMLEAAKAAAQTGDILVAEEALVDAYNRVFKMLQDLEANQYSTFAKPDVKRSIAFWRGSVS